MRVRGLPMTAWTRDPAGGAHPVPVAKDADGRWQTEAGQVVPEARVFGTPAEAMAGKAQRPKRRRGAGRGTHASRTAPRED